MQNEVKLKYTVITHKKQYSGLFLEKIYFQNSNLKRTKEHLLPSRTNLYFSLSAFEM